MNAGRVSKYQEAFRTFGWVTIGIGTVTLIVVFGAYLYTQLSVHQVVQHKQVSLPSCSTHACAEVADSQQAKDPVIQIPALRVTARITPGVERLDLIRGVGHVPGTAMAGGLGTMALAGHRDTFFRALRSVTPGMHIFVTDAGGRYLYIVESTEVVSPEQIDVLDIVDHPRLVLITCFPFEYVGQAPKRFIVRARLSSLTFANDG